MARVQKSVFSTHDLPVEERFGVWRDSIATIFDVRRQPADTNEVFNASLKSHLLDNQVMLSRCKTSSQHFERSPIRTAHDGLDHYLIQTHVSGKQDMRRGSKTTSAKPGDLIIIDLAEKHDAVAGNFENLSLIIPRQLLAPRLRNPDNQQARVLKCDTPLTTLAVEHLHTLARVADTLTTDAAAEIIEPTLALMASAINGGTEQNADGASSAAASILARAKLHIEENLHANDFSVDRLCRGLKMSRAGIYRLFEPYGGVRAYMQERRLRRSAEVLVAAGKNGRHIYDIAYNFGFTSEAHFSRAFKKRFGISPREVRANRRSPAERRNAGLMERIGDRDYELWLSETLKA